MTTVAITGHRPDKLGGYAPNPLGRAVQRELRARIVELQPTRLITGMALGVDQWAAWIAVKIGVPFVAAVPYENQPVRWPAPKRVAYYELLDRAADVVVVSENPTNERDAAEKLQRRNEWMADRCDVLLAVWDGSDSGTGNCVRYAERVGCRIVIINPRALVEATQ